MLKSFIQPTWCRSMMCHSFSSLYKKIFLLIQRGKQKIGKLIFPDLEFNKLFCSAQLKIWYFISCSSEAENLINTNISTQISALIVACWVQWVAMKGLSLSLVVLILAKAFPIAFSLYKIFWMRSGAWKMQQQTLKQRCCFCVWTVTKKVEKRVSYFSLSIFPSSPVGRLLEGDSECNANICARGTFYCDTKVTQFCFFEHGVRTQKVCIHFHAAAQIVWHQLWFINDSESEQ